MTASADRGAMTSRRQDRPREDARRMSAADVVSRIGNLVAGAGFEPATFRL